MCFELVFVHVHGVGLLVLEVREEERGYIEDGVRGILDWRLRRCSEIWGVKCGIL